MKSLPVIIITALGSLCAIGCILLIIVILRTSDENRNPFSSLRRLFNRPSSTEQTTDHPMRIPDRFRSTAADSTTGSASRASAPQSSFPAPVYNRTGTCSEMVPASVLTSVISGNNLFCKRSPWSKQWANPGGKGIRSARPGLSFSDSVVIDTLTGIMWQRYALPQPVVFNQLDSVISYMNTTGWQGYANWRIPTIEELLTLLSPERNRHGHYLPKQWNSNADDIWSCNAACDSLSIRWRWVVRMSHGRCNVGRPDIKRSVLAVREIR